MMTAKITIRTNIAYDDMRSQETFFKMVGGIIDQVNQDEVIVTNDTDEANFTVGLHIESKEDFHVIYNKLLEYKLDCPPLYQKVCDLGYEIDLQLENVDENFSLISRIDRELLESIMDEQKRQEGINTFIFTVMQNAGMIRMYTNKDNEVVKH